MKSRFVLTLPLIGCFAFVSCFPIPGDKPRRKTKPDSQATITSEEQQQIEAQREMIKQRELDKEKEAEKLQLPDGGGTQGQTTPPTGGATPPTSDYPFANPVPGKTGFVFSPYNNKMVDVRDIPSGTLVRDPTYPEADKKFFRVP
jgi:hypothetical protein